MNRLVFLILVLSAGTGLSRSMFENNGFAKGIALKQERERIAQGNTSTRIETVVLEDSTKKGDILRMTNGDLFSVFLQDQPTASLLLPTTRLQVIPTGGHFVLVDPFGKLIHAKIMDPE